jgi:hypothetical protein
MAGPWFMSFVLGQRLPIRSRFHSDGSGIVLRFSFPVPVEVLSVLT